MTTAPVAQLVERRSHNPWSEMRVEPMYFSDFPPVPVGQRARGRWRVDDKLINVVVFGISMLLSN